MSGFSTWAVAACYLALVVGLHRLTVMRRVRAANLSALERLDWDALLSPLEEAVHGRGEKALRAIRVLELGAPAEEVLSQSGPLPAELKRYALALSLVRTAPLRALVLLEGAEPDTAAELSLREHLRLLHRTGPFELEVHVLLARRRLRQGLLRFGNQPPLYFVRALAAARMGWNKAAVDDLARAVYFSKKAAFYVRAVLDSPAIEEIRPALALQCRAAPTGRSSLK